jgi:hypothetical protein
VRSASSGALRPDVGRRAHTDGARAAECAGVRQKKCGDILPVGKSSLSVFGARILRSASKEITALLVIDTYNEFISAGPPSIDNRTARIRTEKGRCRH